MNSLAAFLTGHQSGYALYDPDAARRVLNNDGVRRIDGIRWGDARTSWGCPHIGLAFGRGAPRSNRTKSSVRVRVEHVFGAQVKDMGGTLVRTIGPARASAKIGMKNRAYNEEDQELIRGINSPTNAPSRPAATPEPVPGVIPGRGSQDVRQETRSVTGQSPTTQQRPTTPTGAIMPVSSRRTRPARPGKVKNRGAHHWAGPRCQHSAGPFVRIPARVGGSVALRRLKTGRPARPHARGTRCCKAGHTPHRHQAGPDHCAAAAARGCRHIRERRRDGLAGAQRARRDPRCTAGSARHRRAGRGQERCYRLAVD